MKGHWNGSGLDRGGVAMSSKAKRPKKQVSIQRQSDAARAQADLAYRVAEVEYEAAVAKADAEVLVAEDALAGCVSKPSRIPRPTSRALLTNSRWRTTRSKSSRERSRSSRRSHKGRCGRPGSTQDGSGRSGRSTPKERSGQTGPSSSKRLSTSPGPRLLPTRASRVSHWPPHWMPAMTPIGRQRRILTIRRSSTATGPWARRPAGRSTAAQSGIVERLIEALVGFGR